MLETIISALVSFITSVCMSYVASTAKGNPDVTEVVAHLIFSGLNSAYKISIDAVTAELRDDWDNSPNKKLFDEFVTDNNLDPDFAAKAKMAFTERG